MTKRLVGEINQKCHRDTDVLYHIGDFVLYGKERGIESSRIKPKEFEKLIKPKIIHILGNHDLNNKVQGSILGAYVKIGGLTAWLQHYPPWYDDHKAPLGNNIDIYLCGHVHDSWTFKRYRDKLVINVGVDSTISQYRPVSTQQIIQCLQKFNKGTLEFKNNE